MAKPILFETTRAQQAETAPIRRKANLKICSLKAMDLHLSIPSSAGMYRPELDPDLHVPA